MMSIDALGALRLKKKTKKTTFPRKYVTSSVRPGTGRPWNPFWSKYDHIKDIYRRPIGK